MLVVQTKKIQADQGKHSMHDIILGVAFIAMVAAPAMVATLSGKKEYDPDPQPEPVARPVAAKVQRTGEIIRPRSVQREERTPRVAPTFDAPTLPMYRSRGMNNR